MIDRRLSMPSGGGARSPQSTRSTRPSCFCLLSSFIFLLTTSIFLLSSCTSPTPPPPPPPAGPDTTSHEFIWQIDTLGDGNSSVLYDVAIINDTTIWAVGEIYLKDSTGQVDPDAYNLAKWNGRIWSFQRVLYPFGGAWFNVPLHSVFALKQDDVWVGSNQPMHWNGVSWRTFDLGSDTWNGWINKIWAGADAGTYLVGNGGAIAHFDGTTWRRIESGTTLHLYDVWGCQSSADSVKILAAGGDLFKSLDRVILRLGGLSASVESDLGIPYGLHGLWFQSGTPYWLVGDGIYRKDDLNDTSWTKLSRDVSPFYSFAIRGSRANNMFIVGGYGNVVHFNGSSWQAYPELILVNDSYLSVAVTERLVAIVGGEGRVVIGRRP